jgi:hypothetical protein
MKQRHWTWFLTLILIILTSSRHVGAKPQAILSLVDTVQVGDRPGALVVDTDQARNDVLIYDRGASRLRILDGDTLTLTAESISLPTADWGMWMAYDRLNRRTYALTTERVGVTPNAWVEAEVSAISQRQVVNTFSINAQYNTDPSNLVDTAYEVGGLVFKQPQSEGDNLGRLIIDNPRGGTLDVVDLDAAGVEPIALQRHAYRAPVSIFQYEDNRGNTLALEPRHETGPVADLTTADLLYVADLNHTRGHVRRLSFNQAPAPLQVSTLSDVDLTGHVPFGNGNQGLAMAGAQDRLYVASSLQSFERGFVAQVDTGTNQVQQIIQTTYGDAGFVHVDWYDAKRAFVITFDGFGFDDGYYLHLIYDGSVVDSLRLGDKFDGETERDVRDMVFDPYHRRLYVTLDTTVVVVDVAYGAAAAPLPLPGPAVASIEITAPWYGGTLESPDGQATFTFVNWVSQPTAVTYTELLRPMADMRAAQGDRHALLIYELEAETVATGVPLTDVNAYAVTVRYGQNPAINSTLVLYRWTGVEWTPVSGSYVNTVDGTVRASPDEVGTFAVMGETRRVSLPLVIRN